MSLISKQAIHADLVGGEKFFQSLDVKVFPCAYRGYWESFSEKTKTDSFTRNGSNKEFELTFAPLSIISVSGHESIKYTVQGKKVTFESAPTASDTKIQIKYAYLSNETKRQGFDPEAQATTEYNLTNLYGKLSVNKESYVISFIETSTGSGKYLLKCVIGGYYFEINNVEINDIKNKYLGIKLREIDLENSDDDSDRKSKLLESIIGDSLYLDVATLRDDKFVFTGLAVADTATGYDYTLQVVNASGNINWRSKTILNTLDSGSGKHSIQNLHETNSKNSIASGDYSLAFGTKVEAKNTNSTALGNNTKTNMDNQLVLGKFNVEKNDAYVVIGNGSSNTSRDNVFEVKNTGKIVNDGGIETTGDISSNGANRINKLALGNSTENNSGAIDIYGTSTSKVFSVDNTGNTSIEGNLELENDFMIHSDKFTVEAASGDTTIAGKLDVNSNITTKGNITANKSGENKLILGSTVSSSTGSIKVYGTGNEVVFSVDTTGETELSGNLGIKGKATASQTSSTDDNDTLTTKKYVDDLISRANGIIADNKSASDAGISNLDTALEAAKTKLENDIKTAVDEAIDELEAHIESRLTESFGQRQNSGSDATVSASTGKYIQKVTQENGTIATESGAFATSVTSTNNSSAPTSKAVYDHLAGIWSNDRIKNADDNFDCLKDIILNATYPVGSIYMMYSSDKNITTCPIASSLGGTWTKIESGRFLVSANDTTSSPYYRGETGGSADAKVIAHSHNYSGAASCSLTAKGEITYTSTESGSHTHNVSFKASKAGTGNWTGFEGNAGDGDKGSVTSTTTSSGAHTHSVTIPEHTHAATVTIPSISSYGEDGKNKNLPPFLAVYMWRRER